MEAIIRTRIAQMAAHCGRYLTWGREHPEEALSAIRWHLTLFLKIQGILPARGEYNVEAAVWLCKFWRGYLVLLDEKNADYFLNELSPQEVADFIVQLRSDTQDIIDDTAHGSITTKAQRQENMVDCIRALKHMCEPENLAKFCVFDRPPMHNHLTKMHPPLRLVSSTDLLR